jgi:hypothetical protein
MSCSAAPAGFRPAPKRPPESRSRPDLPTPASGCVTMRRRGSSRHDLPAERRALTDIEAMGPIDYIVIEWPGRQPDGTALPALLDLVDRGVVRVLDLVFIAKEDDGSVTALELSALDDAFGVFEGAASGLLTSEDVVEAGAALEPGTSGAVLVWENSWAAPLAIALRKNGAQLVASGRIPTQELVAALDAAS